MHPWLVAIQRVTGTRRGVTAGTLGLMVLAACSTQPRPPEVDAGLPVDVPLIYVAAEDATPGFRAAAEKAARAALPGSRLTFDAADAARARLRIDLGLSYRKLTESEFESVWRTTTMLLLTVYPSTCNHRSYDLTARLSSPSGVSRHYASSDSTVAWLWLLNGEKCGDTPTAEEVNSVTQRMLASIFRDMRRDDALDAVARGIVGPEGPLVNIRSNRAGAVVEQVARLERPFLRWVLDATDASADYELNLFFEVEEGHFSLGRSYLAIGTGGLSTLGGGLCTGSHVSLNAYVIGPAMPGTQAYLLTDSVATRITNSTPGVPVCEKIDEQTRPEVFAALVGRLFEAVAKDRLTAGPTSAGTSVALPPLVRVETSRGEAMLRQAVQKALPFPRYVFGSSSSMGVPDYVLRLDLTMSGGARRKLTAMQAFGLGFGVTTPCEPTTFTLAAQLTDAAGAALRQYELSRAFPREGGLGDAGCQDDEHSNPGAVLKLADELFLGMKRDGAAAVLAAPHP